MKEEEKVEEKQKRSYKLVLAILAVVIVGLGYYFRGVFVVAMVDGRPITRLSLIKELERQGGKTAMDSLVTQALIEAEARKRGVSVLPKDVDEEIVKIEEDLVAQGQDLDQVLGAQSMDRNQLAKQVRIQKMVEQMLAGDMEVTGEEIDKYIEDYGSLFPEGMSDEEKRASAKEQVEQQKLAEEFYGWLEEAKNNAKINYFVNY